jgi:hypothetical protein
MNTNDRQGEQAKNETTTKDIALIFTNMNFPFIFSNIQADPASEVYISQ